MVFPTINNNIVISKESKLIADLNKGSFINMTEAGFIVLNLINGHDNTETIYEKLSSEYDVSYDKMMQFITLLSSQGILSLNYQPDQNHQLEKENIHIVSIELTNKCNIKCRYCYGAFTPTNHTYLTLKDIKPLFEVLKERGVEILELTGGEPTLNPEFNEIFELACETFRVVTVLSNAVHFSNRHIELFKKYAKKINFSISIDGFSEKSNSYQRQAVNTFDKTLRNILLLNNEVCPKSLRVVYMLTNDNKDEMDDFFQFMVDHNIQEGMMSVPEYIQDGRHYDLPDGCNMSDRNSQSRKDLEIEGNQITQKYRGKIKFPSDKLGKDGIRLGNAYPNCGAGWSTLSIKANGDVVPCNMMNNHYIMGNVIEDKKLNFLSRKNKIYDFFSKVNINAEAHNRDCCKICEYNNYCFKCINKIIIANRKRLNEGKGICSLLVKNGFTKDFIEDKND